MGCGSTKQKIIDTNDLVYFNIINMCNSFQLNVQTIQDVKNKSERFKVLDFENVKTIIITIKPNNLSYFITTVWIGAKETSNNNLDCFNLCVKKYHHTYEDLDRYLNETINDIVAQ